MNRPVIYIAIEPGEGRPVGIARVTDPHVLASVARAAVEQAQQRADSAAQRNSFLGKLYRDEARQVERYLRVLIPTMDDAAAVPVS